jgi:hypothetical protein
MAYGKILVDQLENSEGRKVDISQVASRRFDTVADAEASTFVSGEYITISERADALYLVQASGYTAMNGDISLSSGQVLDLQTYSGMSAKQFGIIGDGSNEFTTTYNAIFRCASEDIVLDFSGLTVSTESTMYLPESAAVMNLSMQAIGTNWASNTADVDSGVVGMPMLIVNNENVRLLGRTYIDCGLTTIDSTNEDVAAAGIAFRSTSQSCISDDIFVQHYNGYGVWFEGKHTDSYHAKIEARQWIWGESGWFDVSLRTAYGVANSSGDFAVDFVVSYYNKSNIHITDGAFSTMWGKVHPYNGSDEVAALDNITQTGGTGQMFPLVYLDNGYITLTDAFSIQFGIIRQVVTSNASNATVFRLITSGTDTTASNLYVGRVNVSSNNLVTYSTKDGGTWSDSKGHIFASVTRRGTTTNELIARPHQEHSVVQTYGERKRYEINSDGGSPVIDASTGLVSLRETRYGSLFTAARLGGVARMSMAGNLSSDMATQPSNGDVVCEFQMIGSNGDSFGNGTNRSIGEVGIQLQATEDWDGTSMGSKVRIMGTKNGESATSAFLSVSGTSLSPGGDDLFDLGDSGIRWTNVFATNSVINTSDARLKTDLVALTDDEVSAATAISKSLGYTWQWSEGGDRTHVGPTVQMIMEIMKDNNLTPFDYSFICYDEWDDQYESVEVEPEYIDEDGNVVPAVYESQLVMEAGDRYSFRENELMKFVAAGLSQRNDSLEARIEAIEAKLSE